MSISNFVAMDKAELELEISKQEKRITNAKKTIALLRKLQLAESMKEGMKTNGQYGEVQRRSSMQSIATHPQRD